MRLRRRLQLLFVPFLVLLAANLALDRYFVHQRDQVRAVVNGRLNPARLALGDLLTAIVDQETGERGYIITGQDAFLDPYRSGEAAADARLDDLDRLLGPDRGLGAGVGRIRSRITAWRQLGPGFELEAKRAGRDAEASALVGTRTGMALFDGARAEIADLQAAVRSELDRRNARLEALRQRLSELRVASLVLGVVIVVASRRLLTRWISEPIEALGAAVRDVAGGAIERAVPAPGPPDVAELGRDVEAMRVRLLAEVEAASAAEGALAQRGMVVLGLRDELASRPLEVHDALHISRRASSPPKGWWPVTGSTLSPSAPIAWPSPSSTSPATGPRPASSPSRPSTSPWPPWATAWGRRRRCSGWQPSSVTPATCS